METQENGEEEVNLLSMKLIAGSFTTPTAPMNFTIVAGELCLCLICLWRRPMFCNFLSIVNCLVSMISFCYVTKAVMLSQPYLKDFGLL